MRAKADSCKKSVVVLSSTGSALAADDNCFTLGVSLDVSASSFTVSSSRECFFCSDLDTGDAGWAVAAK